MDNKIKGLLNSYKKKFSISSQRAALLSRNAAFKEELDKMLEEYELKYLLPLKYVFQKSRGKGQIYITKLSAAGVEIIGPRFSWPKGLEKEKHTRDVMENALHSWTNFCRRWSIMPEWDGKVKSLARFMEPPIEFYWIEGKEGSAPVFFLRINNWTILDDIKDVWDQVSEYQNMIWEKQERRTNFSRDLCWYDLSKEYGLKSRDIARLWADNYPDEIDLLVLRRMKADKNREDLRGRSRDDHELVKAIKSGFLAEKYRREFDEERKHYITGETAGKKLNSPFADAIKKAILRMEQQISRPDVSSLRTSVRVEDILKIGSSLLPNV
jgi:hypothetical protein